MVCIILANMVDKISQIVPYNSNGIRYKKMILGISSLYLRLVNWCRRKSSFKSDERIRPRGKNIAIRIKLFANR